MKLKSAIWIVILVVAAAPVGAQVVGGQVVQGNVAHGATDAGNPVKVGGKYNSGGVTLTDGQRGDLQLDASGFLKVNVSAGSSGNAAASATGSAVPADGDYAGINVAGTLRGWTGVNPSGSIYAGQMDLASVAGSTVATAATGIIKVGMTDASGNAINSTSNALNVNFTNTSLAATQSGTWTVVPKTACGTTATDSGYIANVATTGTDIFTSSTCVDTLFVCNSTASNSTFQIKDKTATPNVYSGAIPLLANSCVTLKLGYTKYNLGLTLFAGNATTIQAQAFGWQ